jgi:hypothetical protein
MTMQRHPRPARREPRQIPPAVFLEPCYMDGQPYETTRGLPGPRGDGGQEDDDEDW